MHFQVLVSAICRNPCQNHCEAPVCHNLVATTLVAENCTRLQKRMKTTQTPGKRFRAGQQYVVVIGNEC